MSPIRKIMSQTVASLVIEKRDALEKPVDPDSLILEAWAQGYMVGSLVIMAFMTMANMRRGVLLHKVSWNEDPSSKSVLINLSCSSFFLRYGF